MTPLIHMIHAIVTIKSNMAHFFTNLIKGARPLSTGIWWSRQVSTSFRRGAKRTRWMMSITRTMKRSGGQTKGRTILWLLSKASALRRGSLRRCSSGSKRSQQLSSNVIHKTKLFTNKMSVVFIQKDEILRRASANGCLKQMINRWKTRQNIKKKIILADQATTGCKLIGEHFDLL